MTFNIKPSSNDRYDMSRMSVNSSGESASHTSDFATSQAVSSTSDFKSELAKTIDIGRVKTQFVGGELIGNYYEFIRNKRFGVEPGFEALKEWKPTDNLKIRDPEHKYNKKAVSYIGAQLKDEAKNPDFIQAYRRAANIGEDVDAAGHFDQLVADSKQTILKEILNSASDAIKRAIKKHVRVLHYVKLNYKLEGSLPAEGSPYNEETADKAKMVNRKVMLPLDRAVGGSTFTKSIFRWINAETIKEKNWGAVKEYAANKLYNAMAFETTPTKLKIVRATYEDGTPKLLLDGKHITGPQGDETFETFNKQIGREQMQAGRLIGNQIQDEHGNLYDIDESHLAKVGLSAGVLGDWDKLGPRGDNLGYVLVEVNGKKMAQIRNLDPGKAMPANEAPKKGANALSQIIYKLFMFLMGVTDVSRTIQSNASFAIPNVTLKEKIFGGYRNFTIFHDTTMHDRIEGAKFILERRGEYESIFNGLEEQFGTKAGDDPALNFANEIKEMKEDFFSRLDYLEGIVKENAQLQKSEIDILDSLEKLSSSTLSTFRTKNGEQPSVHLQIDLNNRKEWRMDRENNQFFHKAKNVREANKIAAQLKTYLGEQKGLVCVEGSKVILKIEDLDEMTHAFAESKVAEHKGHRLFHKA